MLDRHLLVVVVAHHAAADDGLVRMVMSRDAPNTMTRVRTKKTLCGLGWHRILSDGRHDRRSLGDHDPF